jgi:hypothetical protein
VQTSALLANRPVLSEDKGNLVNEVEVALQTQALAVVVAPVAGEVKEGALPRRAAWRELLEVAVHRGVLDGADTPSTIAVIDELRGLVHGAHVDPASETSQRFACVRHELRETGDGTYVRVLTIAVIDPIVSITSTN